MDISSKIFTRFWYLAIFLAAGVLVLVTWANYQFAVQNPGGNDFLVHWVGTRAFLIDGRSPYSDEVAVEIQTLAYGRPARAGEHELRVAYPLYSVIFFLPFALFEEYTLARAVWMTILEGGVIGLAWMILALTRWRVKLWFLAIFLIFAISWYHGLRPIVNGNAVVIVSVLIAGSLLALRSGRDELAGILLAMSTIKPHLVALSIGFILLWTLSHRRWRTLLWLIITFGLLSAATALFIPDWPIQNLREILRYSSYNPPGTPGAVFATWFPATGERFGWVLSAIMGLIILLEWIIAMKKEFRWFLWTTCLTLVVSQWIGIQTDPGNFILLFLPLGLVFSAWEERWGRWGLILTIFSMVGLLVGLWGLFLRTITVIGQPVQNPILFFPLPLFLIITLYWIRWWAIRPSRLLIEQFRAFDEGR